jgi:hypothetical protein
MAQAKLHLGGIPYGPDLKKLTDTFGVPEVGQMIGYEQIEAALGPAHRPPAAPLADPFARQHPAHGEAPLLPPAPVPPGGAPAHGAPRAPRALPPVTPSQSRPKPER